MKRDCEYFMDQIIKILKDKSSSELLKKRIDPKCVDSNGNGIFHYFSEYSLEKFYKLNYNKIKEFLIDEEKFKEIVNEYKNQIPIYIDLLDELKCDKFINNNQYQTPLIYSIIQKNYYIAKEYIKRIDNMNLFSENDYQKIFIHLINSGDCLREDCLTLISYILSLAKRKNLKVFNEIFLNKDNVINCLTPILLICKNFSDNIYEKYNQIIIMKSSDYYEKYFNTNKSEVKEKILAEIKIKAKNDLDNFITKLFFPLLKNLIIFGADINYIEKNRKQSLPKSAFIYLMSYPFFDNISLFVENNNIDINYQDEEGKTAFMHLIDNKNIIISISKDTYNNTFNFFINNNKLEMLVTDKRGISIFGLCLMKGYLIDAKKIYVKSKKNEKIKMQLHSEILFFIINYINNRKKYKRIINFLNIFNKAIKYSLFNDIYERTFLHYICLYSSNDNSKFYIFKEIYYGIKNEIFVDSKKLDIYKRNALFYLFIDENEKIKNNDPYMKLELCLKNTVFNNLNDQDIYGNNLLYYAVISKSYKSIELLLKFGVSLKTKNYDNNTIYSIASFLGDFDLFLFLYNFNKDTKIFLQKVFHPSHLFIKSENNIVKILIDFYKEMNVPLPDISIFKEEIKKNIIQNYIYKNNNLHKNEQKIEFKTNYICLNDNKFITKLDNITKEIKINEKEIIEDNIFLNDQNYYIEALNNFKNINLNSENISVSNTILSENLFQYCKLKKYENFCNFIINEKYHPISICNDLIVLNYKDELYYYINHFLPKNDLLNYTNEDKLTILHILAKIDNDSSYYEEKDFKKYNISNIFDNFGNTPIYYACEKLNINFIETFSNYSFSSINNDPKIIKYSLFIETNNKTTPLKALYYQIKEKDMKILKLIIDISINIKKVYILNIILFLAKNYFPISNDVFLVPYKENLDNEDYIRKIIGLYSFYTQELNGDFNKDEFEEINPIFYCFKENNFEFLFNVLLKEKNMEINTKDNEGKNLIHLIVNINENINKNWSKKEILIKALEIGIDFNIKDNYGMLPIDYAYSNKDNDIINILIDKYNNCEMEIPKDKTKLIEEENKDEEEKMPTIFFY